VGIVGALYNDAPNSNRSKLKVAKFSWRSWSQGGTLRLAKRYRLLVNGMSDLRFSAKRVAHRPDLISAEAWVAPNATLSGHVEVQAAASIWFGAVLRGDVEPIIIGQGSNVQDLCCFHADEGYPCVLGRNVTVGHRAIIHGAVVEDETLIGMGAILLNGARIGQHCLVGAGCLIPEGRLIPPRSLVVGTPGRVIRKTTDEEVQKILSAAEHYRDASSAYRACLSEADNGAA
jgi:carbonic anhydrase/acetyltransferase-like protein (isoleucine patch superfamily)